MATIAPTLLWTDMTIEQLLGSVTDFIFETHIDEEMKITYWKKLMPFIFLHPDFHYLSCWFNQWSHLHFLPTIRDSVLFLHTMVAY